MKLKYKTRRILSLIVLLVLLPSYIVVVVTIMNMLGRTSILLELLIYFLLGILWAIPLKFIFKGVGKENPENKKN
tara:strand:+ start:58 stop:282 length:225 start_codon:yes stop_codon:yes gene_type:complete